MYGSTWYAPATRSVEAWDMIGFFTSSPSGPLDNSRPVLGLDAMNRFVDNLKLYWPERARVLMITAFPEDDAANDQMVDFFSDALEEAGLLLETFDLWDHRSDDTSLRLLLSYHLIMLGGGHVPTQNRYFRSIGLRNKMHLYRRYRRHGIVMGISAGTMNAADRVYAQPELDGEAVDPDYRRFMRGLGMTKTNILPHYQMVRDSVLDNMRLYEDITFADSFGKRFLVLPDGSYLLSVHGKETVWGEAYEIRDGRMRQIAHENEVVPWKA